MTHDDAKMFLHEFGADRLVDELRKETAEWARRGFRAGFLDGTQYEMRETFEGEWAVAEGRANRWVASVEQANKGALIAMKRDNSGAGE